MSKVNLYRFHPVTGQDANDFSEVEMTVDQKVELAQMVRDGARFYWERSRIRDVLTVKAYSRLERSNAHFALSVAGIAHRFIDDKGECLKAGEK